MESLYRKYRPQTFQDVVGQTHVVSTLERAVTEGRTSHAYLFCGPRGTGKTTMARILAKALLCEQGPGKLPDGTCEECKLIAAGEHPDVYELDAASRTGVDNVREEIINRVDFAPVRGRYKVYIIDEVHMLTPAAFNALLKTLEEPPAHVVFIMCTTDPQKVLPTILSRVQRFDFRAIGADEMHAHLAEICDNEGFTYEDEALDLVVRHAHGGMRDAISTLEQLSVFGDGAVTAAAARDLLGEVSDSRIATVSMALARRDVPMLFSEVAALVDGGRDLLQFTRELMARVRDVYVVEACAAKPGVLNANPDEEKALAEEAAAYGGPERLSRVLTVLGDAASEMRLAVNQRLTLEVALTRAARPDGDLTLESLAERVELLEARLAGGAATGGAAAGASATPAALAGPAATSAGSAPAASAPQPSRGAASAATAAPAPAPTANASASQAKPGAFVPPPLPASLRNAASSVRRPAQASSAPAAGPAPAQVSSASVGVPAPAPSAAPAPRPSTGVPAPQPAASAVSPVSSVAPASKPAASADAVPTSVATPASQQAVPGGTAPAPAAAKDSGAPAAGQQPASQVDMGKLQRTWKSLVDTLLKTNASCGSLLLNATATDDDGSTLTVSLPAGSAFTRRMLERADVKEIVDKAVAAAFGPRALAYVQAGAPAARPEVSPAAKEGLQPAPVKPVEPQSSAKPSNPVPESAALPASAPTPGAASGMSASAPGSASGATMSAPAPASTSAPNPGSPASAPALKPVSAQALAPTAPAPAPAPVPVPTPVPAPVPIAAPVPAPVPDDEPPYDEVPYDDADVYIPGEEEEERPLASSAPVPSKAAALKIPDVARRPAPAQPAAANPSAQTLQRSAPAAEPAPWEPLPGPQPGAASQPAASSDEVPESAEEIVSMVSDIFGKTKVTVVDEDGNPIQP